MMQRSTLIMGMALLLLIGVARVPQTKRLYRQTVRIRAAIIGAEVTMGARAFSGMPAAMLRTSVLNLRIKAASQSVSSSGKRGRQSRMTGP